MSPLVWWLLVVACLARLLDAFLLPSPATTITSCSTSDYPQPLATSRRRASSLCLRSTSSSPGGNSNGDEEDALAAEKAALYDQLGEILLGDAPYVDPLAGVDDSDREAAQRRLEESRRKYKAAKEEREQSLMDFEQKLKEVETNQLEKLDSFINQEKRVLDDFEKSASAVRKAQDTVDTLSKELAQNSIVTQSILFFDPVKAIALLVGLDTLYVSYLAVNGSDNIMPSMGVEAILVAALFFANSRRQSEQS